MRPPGRYAKVAELVTEAGMRTVELAGVEPGMDVLDVACGTGNASIPAAQAGARVTGLDPSPELLEIARERGADYMIELEWVEGDPMELPFPDASFDRVLSVFGHMFAADHERTAAELRRVCRPGGAIAIASWVAGDSMERMREIADGPEPPADAILWGSETHVRALLGEARFERATLEWPDESVRGDYLVAVIPR